MSREKGQPRPPKPERQPRDPYQIREYKELQAAKPCCYRGELKMDIKHEPPSACCKNRDVITAVRFFCKLLDKDIHNNTICWACPSRRETLPPEETISENNLEDPDGPILP